MLRCANNPQSFQYGARRSGYSISVNDHNPGLQKTAGWVHLWALGVGAVISGNFFGWQTGLIAGGFGGLLLATIVIAGMYFCLVFSIAEMSAALPSAGGFYNFTRAAFGTDRAFLNGLTDAIEYVTTPAVIVAGIAGYMRTLVPVTPDWVWWIGFYCLFVGINVKGAALTFRVSMIITALAAAVLVFFCASAVMTGSFEWSKALNVPPSPGESVFFRAAGMASLPHFRTQCGSSSLSNNFHYRRRKVMMQNAICRALSNGA